MVGLVEGDWAAALWDAQAETLTLVRAPLASAQIHFAEEGGGVRFASLAQAVAATGHASPAPDWDAVASAVGHLSPLPGRTAFRGVRRVEAGQRLQWRAGRWEEAQPWRPELTPVQDRTQLAGRLREEAERAVALRLPPGGTIVTQLTAGRDSSLVTALAARLAPGRVEAVTAAPKAGGVGPPSARHIFDETEAAARTARHLGIPHHLVGEGAPAAQLRAVLEVQRWHFQPTLHAIGPGWWRQMASLAAERGASAILTGRLGNLTASIGGVTALSALRSEQGLAATAALVPALARVHGWQTALNQCLPEGLRSWTASLRHGEPARTHPLWRGPLAHALGTTVDASSLRGGGFRRHVFQMLASAELADRILFGLSGGVPVRHPLADRRLAEFCLRIPAMALVGPDGGRPLFEEAFADLLPQFLLRERRRGRHGADWWLTLRPESLRPLLRDLAAHRLVADAIDLDRAHDELRAWPRDFREALASEDRFRFFLRTVALALFLHENFDP